MRCAQRVVSAYWRRRRWRGHFIPLPRCRARAHNARACALPLRAVPRSGARAHSGAIASVAALRAGARINNVRNASLYVYQNFRHRGRAVAAQHRGNAGRHLRSAALPPSAYSRVPRALRVETVTIFCRAGVACRSARAPQRIALAWRRAPSCVPLFIFLYHIAVRACACLLPRAQRTAWQRVERRRCNATPRRLFAYQHARFCSSKRFACALARAAGGV